MGNTALQTLLVLGATTGPRHVRKEANGPGWLIELPKRRPLKVSAVAIANKMTRRMTIALRAHEIPSLFSTSGSSDSGMS